MLYVKWQGNDDLFDSFIDKKKYCYLKFVYFENHVVIFKTE